MPRLVRNGLPAGKEREREREKRERERERERERDACHVTRVRDTRGRHPYSWPLSSIHTVIDKILSSTLLDWLLVPEQ